MRKITELNLINAFGGESQAYMRYVHFANQAKNEKLNNLARLFRAIAHAEYIHAGDHFQELKHLDGGFVANSMAVFGPGNSEKNLKLAIAGETYEIEEMYPTYIEIAKFQGENSAQRSFEWSYGTEKMHKMFYEKALESVSSGKDVYLGPIQVCEVCGYTLEGEAPDMCPICGALNDNFTAFK